MAKLMCQHRRQLVRRLRGRNQTQVHTQISPGQGKGVHPPVTRHQQLPGQLFAQLQRHLACVHRGLEQGRPHRLHIVAHHHIVQVIGVAIQVACNAVAQAPLGGQAHHLSVAQMGQGVARAHGLRLRRRATDRGQQAQHCHRQPGATQGHTFKDVHPPYDAAIAARFRPDTSKAW